MDLGILRHCYTLRYKRLYSSLLIRVGFVSSSYQLTRNEIFLRSFVRVMNTLPTVTGKPSSFSEVCPGIHACSCTLPRFSIGKFARIGRTGNA